VHEKLGFHLSLDPLYQLLGGSGINRDDLDSSHQAPPEDSDPLDSVVTPKQDPVTLLETLLLKIAGKGPNSSVELSVGEFPGAKTI